MQKKNHMNVWQYTFQYTETKRAKFILCAIIFAMLFFCLPKWTLSQESFKDYIAEVTKIIDGDTIEVTISKGAKVIRLWGIDTPEWDQPYSFASKTFLADQLLHKKIVVEPLYYDKHKRLVANILINNNNISQVLLEYGFAWVHVYFCDKPICEKWKKLESISREKKRGLWQEPSPVPPWMWKRIHHRSPSLHQ